MYWSPTALRSIKKPIHTQKKPREIVADILNKVSEENLRKKLSNPHVLVSSIGSKWDYQENGGFKKELCKTFGNNLNKFNSKENLDKNSSPVPLLVCGIGEGKSRALQEAPKMLKKLAEDSKTFSQVLVFQVTFENGTPVDKKLNTREQVPLRILYHLSDQTISYSQFEIANGNQGLTLGDVLDYLAKDNDKPSAVLLMIDGVHNLAGKPMKLPEDDPLRIFLCNVVSGDYILCQRRGHFIFPLCSCTASIMAIEALKQSSTEKAWIPLPKLIIVPLVNGKQIRITQDQLSVMGGHGRAVEVLAEIIANNTEQSMTDIQLYSEVAEQLSSNKSGFGGFESDHVTALLKACFLRDTLIPGRDDANIPVGEDKQLHVSTFTQHGLLRIENQKLIIAPIWLLMNKKQKNGHILQGWQGATPVSEVQWEQFGAWFRMFLSRVHKNGGETMSLKDFHKGMLWADDSNPPTFNNVLVTHVLQSKFKISTKSESKAEEIKNESQAGSWNIKVESKEVDIKDGKSIVINAKAASAGDSFIPLTSSQGEIFTEVYQQKLYLKIVFPKSDERFLDFAMSEIHKAVGDNDVLIFSTQAEFPSSWESLLKGKLVGVVHRSNFNDYFGPFAAFWPRKPTHSPSSSLLRHRAMSWVPTQFKFQRPPTNVVRRICRVL